MKLDSEDQRIQLLQLIGSVVLQVKISDIKTMEAQMDIILDPIRNAQIEVPNEAQALAPLPSGPNLVQ